MGPGKKIQNIQVAGVVLKPQESAVVDTNKISKQERKWDGTLIEIRPLKNGKSQVLRLC